MSFTLKVALLMLLTAAPHALHAQEAASPPTAQAAANSDDAKLTAAEEALEKNDLKTAASLLAELAKDHPQDAHVLFDLGYADEGLGDTSGAKIAYTGAVAANPQLGEAHIALGLLLARTNSGSREDTVAQLRAGAVNEKTPADVRARAYRALAQLEQPLDSAKANDDLLQAVRLSRETEPDIVAGADLALAGGEFEAAEKAYRRALEQQPDDIAAATGLGRSLQKQDRPVQADEVLTAALTKHSLDPGLLAQLAVVKVSEGKPEEAVGLIEPLVPAGSAASNPALARELARLYAVTGQMPKAEALYGQLADAQPNDPALLDDYADVLVRQTKFAQAETILTRAVGHREAWPRPQDWAEAQSHLAFAASRNHHPQVVLQALSARATVLPNSAATLFLQATAHDSLHQNKDAIEAYRAFLAAANGKFPDEEFETRHRLVALEHTR